MNNILIAAALRQLATAFETPSGSVEAQPENPPAVAPAKRGRGRLVQGEATPATAPAASPTSTEADPFDTPKPAPTATLEQVRAALTSLKDAASQEIALGVLKDAGKAANLTELK